jgi:hypothetical protein
MWAPFSMLHAMPEASRALPQPNRLRSALDRFAQACVRSVAQPEFERIRVRHLSQLTHVRFTREVLAHRRQGPVCALPQRRRSTIESTTVVRDVVRRGQGRGTGVCSSGNPKRWIPPPAEMPLRILMKAAAGNKTGRILPPGSRRRARVCRPPWQDARLPASLPVRACRRIPSPHRSRSTGLAGPGKPESGGQLAAHGEGDLRAPSTVNPFSSP